MSIAGDRFRKKMGISRNKKKKTRKTERKREGERGTLVLFRDLGDYANPGSSAVIESIGYVG